MKKTYLLLCLLSIVLSGKAQQVFALVPVSKSSSNNSGAWGQHWQMANCNHDIVDTSPCQYKLCCNQFGCRKQQYLNERKSSKI